LFLTGVAALSVLYASAAHAAEFKIEQQPANTAILQVRGVIKHNDIDAVWGVINRLASAHKVLVDLDSGGGYLFPAATLGSFIYARGWDTVVWSGATCTSACAYIWLAGKTRWYARGANIGFHGSCDCTLETPVHLRRRSAQGDIHLTAYMKEIGIPANVIAWALSLPPTDMLQLSEFEMGNLPLEAKRAKILEPLEELTEDRPPPMIVLKSKLAGERDANTP
jgi:hypothetical protein